MSEMTDTPEAEPKKSRSRIIVWVVIGLVALVALVYGAIFFYANVINDSPDALDANDLGDALVVDTTEATSEATVGDTAPAATDAPDTGSTDTTAAADGFDGDWTPTEPSTFGYRVEEVLAGVNTTAVGRSSEITGLLTIDGTTATAVEIEVPVDTITSDDSRRDGQFTGRIMSVDEFPTATFTLTEPIEFGTIPTGDETVTATATGDLTLRGVTNSVTFDVTAQTTDGRIGVLGSIPVLFSDYGIDNPSNGIVTTEDNGLVEFVLVFDRA